jgi:hypothetical protein
MRKNVILLLLSTSTLLLGSCQAHSALSGDNSSEETPTSSGVVPTSSTGAESSSAPESSGSTSASSEPDYGSEIVFKGLVKVYYHNDSGSYADKRLWVWGTGVNGAEYTFDNQSSSDDYGVYKIFDMDKAPFNDFDQTAMRFILKNAGTWSGQSPDIVTGFKKYYPYKTTQDGRELVTIYCVDEGISVQTYNQREDALGDRLSKADFTNWTSISCAGTGTQGTRSASEVGLCSSYSLYAFTREYYALSAEEQVAKKGGLSPQERRAERQRLDDRP